MRTEQLCAACDPAFERRDSAAGAESRQSCPTLRDPTDGGQPARLPRPWDSPGKSTGVARRFLPQCTRVKGESEVAQSSPTVRNPMGCSPPGSSIHGISQARALEWVTVAFSGKIIHMCSKHPYVERNTLNSRGGSYL